MTDAPMFYFLFKFLQKSKIYNPKINDADFYLDFIEKNYCNDELENTYTNDTKIYDKKEFDWIYYYVYIIILIDYEKHTKKNHHIYKLIVADIIDLYIEFTNSEFTNIDNFIVKRYEFKNEIDNRQNFSYTNDNGVI